MYPRKSHLFSSKFKYINQIDNHLQVLKSNSIINRLLKLKMNEIYNQDYFIPILNSILMLIHHQIHF